MLFDQRLKGSTATEPLTLWTKVIQIVQSYFLKDGLDLSHTLNSALYSVVGIAHKNPIIWF